MLNQKLENEETWIVSKFGVLLKFIAYAENNDSSSINFECPSKTRRLVLS